MQAGFVGLVLPLETLRLCAQPPGVSGPLEQDTQAYEKEKGDNP